MRIQITMDSTYNSKIKELNIETTGNSVEVIEQKIITDCLDRLNDNGVKRRLIREAIQELKKEK